MLLPPSARGRHELSSTCEHRVLPVGARKARTSNNGVVTYQVLDFRCNFKVVHQDHVANYHASCAVIGNLPVHGG